VVGEFKGKRVECRQTQSDDASPHKTHGWQKGLQCHGIEGGDAPTKTLKSMGKAKSLIEVGSCCEAIPRIHLCCQPEWPALSSAARAGSSPEIKGYDNRERLHATIGLLSLINYGHLFIAPRTVNPVEC
jgi:hypothetical protein